MNKRNKFFLFSLNYINQIFLLLQFIIKNKCDYKPCNGNKIKSIYAGEVECDKICENGNLVNIGDDKYFYVYLPEKKCLIADKCEDKVAYNSKECFKHYEGLITYKIGDFYFSYEEMTSYYGLKDYYSNTFEKECKDYKLIFLN